MIYDCSNCALNCDVKGDAGDVLRHVEYVDGAKCQVVQYEMPLRAVDGEWARVTRMFDRADVVCDDTGRATSIALYGLQP